MHEASIRSAAFWDAVAARVTAKVEPVLGRGEKARGPVIDYLRDFGALVRRGCGSREAVQIIASGRRLLGARSEVGPSDGPLART